VHVNSLRVVVQLKSGKPVSYSGYTLPVGLLASGAVGIRVEYAMVVQDFDDTLDAQTPIIENMVVGVPPVFTGLTRQLDKLVEQPLLGPRSDFPKGRTATVLSCLLEKY
jgi:hypothetical protein